MNRNTDQLMGIRWAPNELQKIAARDDLHISAFRDDGVTCGTPTWIWSVVVDGELYVRAYSGLQSRWYQAAMRQKAGRIRAAGMTKDVVFNRLDGQRPNRRRLPREVRWQSVLAANDRHAGLRGRYVCCRGGQLSRARLIALARWIRG